VSLWAHQKDAITLGIHRGSAGIFHPPGSGKSRIICEILKQLGREAYPVLILTVVEQYEVWPVEMQKWLPGVRVRTAVAVSAKKRAHEVTLCAGVCVINYESFYASRGMIASRGFKTVVLDEAWRISNPAAKTTQAVQTYMEDAKHRFVLSPWPTRKALKDVFSLVRFVDLGESLGKSSSGFNHTYMIPHPAGFGWLVRSGADKEVARKISSCCSIAHDQDIKGYTGVPDPVYSTISVKLRDEDKERYDLIVDEWQSGEEEILGAGVKYLRTLQASSGVFEGQFDPGFPKTRELVNQIKLIGDDEKIIVYGWFRPEIFGLSEVITAETGRPVMIAVGGMTESMGKLLQRWRETTGAVLVCQSAKTAGWHAHEARHCFFHSQPPTAMQRFQAIRRLSRPPQKRIVRVVDLVSRETLDRDVLDGLKTQRDFMDTFRRLVGQRQNR